MGTNKIRGLWAMFEDAWIWIGFLLKLNVFLICNETGQS